MVSPPAAPSPTPSSSWKRGLSRRRADFFSLNPGASWQINDLMHLDVQANASRSHFFRDSPTILVVSCPSTPNAAVRPGCTAPAGGVYATFTNAGQLNPPTITTNIKLTTRPISSGTMAA